MADTIIPTLNAVKNPWAEATSDSDEEVHKSSPEHEEVGDGPLSPNTPVNEGKEEAKNGGDGSTEVVKSQIEEAISKPLSPTGEGGHTGDNGDSLEGSALTANTTSKERTEEQRQLAAEAERFARMMLAPETDEDKHNRLRVVQANQNSHLSSAKTFEELERLQPELLRGILAMGFEKPSKIQETALPLLLMDPPENLIGQAQSGSGKTVSFCMGVLNRVDTTKNIPQALIITPTRELAVQCVQQTLLPMSQFISPGLRVMLALAGTRLETRSVTDHVVVGTPGKVEDWIKRRYVDTRGFKVLVLDEADHMMSQAEGTGFADNCKRINRMISQPIQCLFFSATFPSEVKDFARKLVKGPTNEITLKSDEELILDVITQLWIDLRGRGHTARVDLLKDLYVLLEMGQSIVFCNTRAGTDSVTRALQESGFNCSNLHSQLVGGERDACMEEFRTGRNKVLVTTNVLSRGVDVPAVSLVVNFDVPLVGRTTEPDSETYLHRIGRTGRFGRRGLAINLIDDNESFQSLMAIERHFCSTGHTMLAEAPSDVEALEALIAQRAKLH